MSNRLELNDGHSMPQIGLGVWQVAQDKTANVVSTAIQAGYRLIDGAYIYGNEASMGQGIRQSGVPRSDLFVTSKVWNGDQGYDTARRAIEASLKRIGLGYLDLCLIHWPCPSKDQYVDTWRAFIDAQKDGQLRSIGVSNFMTEHLDRIIDETGVSPVLNQIEINPRLGQAQMRAENKTRNILSQSWTPLGNGASFDTLAIAKACQRTGRSPVQVILRWHIQLGLSVLPRSVNPGHQIQNLQVWDFELTNDEIAAISDLNEDQRCGPSPDTFEME